MASFTAKPFTSPGKAASLPRSMQGEKLEQDKSQTLPSAMPVFSGDLLKQRLAEMHGKKPQIPQKNELHSTSAGPIAAPVISANQLLKHRNSMSRTPAPPTPDAKPKYDKTPEFLRKKLKPSGVSHTNAQEKEDSAQEKEGGADGNEEKGSEKEDTKKSFRNSRLLFENISAAPKITPKPGPRPVPKPRDRNSLKKKTDQSTTENVDRTPKVDEKSNNIDNAVAEKENPDVADRSDISESSKDALNQLDKVLDMEDKIDETAEEVAEKPKLELPIPPTGLELWMNYYVKNSTKLLKLDNLDATDAPPAVNREIRPPIVDRRGGSSEPGSIAAQPHASNSAAAANDDIYDDVASGIGQGDEIYDDVVSATAQGSGSSAPLQGDVADDVYDDVVGATAGLVQDEVYDDVVGGSQQMGDGTVQEGEDLYDDVAVAASVVNDQELYDDVAVTGSEAIPVYEVEDGDLSSQTGEALYEPVETIAQYVVSEGKTPSVPEERPPKPLRTDIPVDKGNKKKEEKERKEKERVEKKRREEAEKQRKKDEEEKKKRDREERKKIEKERRAFNLKPEEDPIPIERHMAECDVKGKGKDLTITRGEYLDVITKNNCPKGKVLVQNSSGKLGYVFMKDIGMDRRKSLLMASSPVAAGVAFGITDEQYDDVCGISASSSSSEIVSLSSGNSFKNGSIAPSFGQSRGVVQLGHSSNASSPPMENDQDEGGDLYEQI